MGWPPGGGSVPLPGEPVSVRAALDAAVLPALQRPPCVVAFSGGRDSSAVLAVAVDTARRHGLDEPVAVSLHFPHAPRAAETDWQELVIRHLRVSDWQRMLLGDELEYLGEQHTSGLRRHGLLWPANCHTLGPTMQVARGGALLTGFDGDGLFGDWRRGRFKAAVVAPSRASLRDAAAALRHPGRNPVAAPPDPGLAWLTESGRQSYAEVLRAEARAPTRWDTWVHWFAGRRHLAAATTAIGLLAGDHDVRATHPLADSRVLAAIARTGGRLGLGGRSAAMTRLFGDLLPPSVLRRASKAVFTEALWGSRSRAFAADWDGAGVDEHLIDVAALRAEWAKPRPHAGAALALHSAWLAKSGQG